jgi:hypothetical protein
MPLGGSAYYMKPPLRLRAKFHRSSSSSHSLYTQPLVSRYTGDPAVELQQKSARAGYNVVDAFVSSHNMVMA